MMRPRPTRELSRQEKKNLLLRNLRIIPLIRGFRKYRETVLEVNLAGRTAVHFLACLRGLHRDKFTFVFVDWL